MQTTRLYFVIGTLSAAVSSATVPALADVDCSIGQKVGNPHCAVVAPLPELGTGLAGLLILAGGLSFAIARRKASTPSRSDEPGS